MSFSLEVKEELLKKIDGPRHCMIAELAAVTAFCGRYENGELVYKSENELVITFLEAILKKLFPDYANGFREIIGYLLVDDKELTTKILQVIKWQDNQGEVKNRFASPRVIGQDPCKKSFLKGAFICTGSVNDPKGAYHFEIVCREQENADLIAELFNKFGLDMKVTARKKSYIAYIKEGAHIIDALNILGAYVAQMDFYNVMILKEMRNDVNRKVNCETANLNKTVTAAMKQIKDIEYIEEKFGLEILGDTLKDTALLRINNPEASLSDLAQLADPPIGKSGMNHRLKSISKFADDNR